MRVLNDEVPDDGDFDAGRSRGEFDHITPEDITRGTGNPPGWLGADDIADLRSRMPIAYVEIVPVRVDDFGRVTQIGSLLRVANDQSIVERTLIAGRVLYHESLREAIARNISKDMGELALPVLPQTLTPFTVAEFFPTPGVSPYFDARQLRLRCAMWCRSPVTASRRMRRSTWSGWIRMARRLPSSLSR